MSKEGMTQFSILSFIGYLGEIKSFSHVIETRPLIGCSNETNGSFLVPIIALISR